jgi:hypothetical protein
MLEVSSGLILCLSQALLDPPELQDQLEVLQELLDPPELQEQEPQALQVLSELLVI